MLSTASLPAGPAARRAVLDACEHVLDVWQKRAHAEGDDPLDVFFILVDVNDPRWRPLVPHLERAATTPGASRLSDLASAAKAHGRKGEVALGALCVQRARAMPLFAGPYAEVAAKFALAPEDGRYLALVLAAGGSTVFPLAPRSA